MSELKSIVESGVVQVGYETYVYDIDQSGLVSINRGRDSDEWSIRKTILNVTVAVSKGAHVSYIISLIKEKLQQETADKIMSTNKCPEIMADIVRSGELLVHGKQYVYFVDEKGTVLVSTDSIGWGRILTISASELMTIPEHILKDRILLELEIRNLQDGHFYKKHPEIYAFNKAAKAISPDICYGAWDVQPALSESIYPTGSSILVYSLDVHFTSLDAMRSYGLMFVFMDYFIQETYLNLGGKFCDDEARPHLSFRQEFGRRISEFENLVEDYASVNGLRDMLNKHPKLEEAYASMQDYKLTVKVHLSSQSDHVHVDLCTPETIKGFSDFINQCAKEYKMSLIKPQSGNMNFDYHNANKTFHFTVCPDGYTMVTGYPIGADSHFVFKLEDMHTLKEEGIRNFAIATLKSILKQRSGLSAEKPESENFKTTMVSNTQLVTDMDNTIVQLTAHFYENVKNDGTEFELLFVTKPSECDPDIHLYAVQSSGTFNRVLSMKQGGPVRAHGDLETQSFPAYAPELIPSISAILKSGNRYELALKLVNDAVFHGREYSDIAYVAMYSETAHQNASTLKHLDSFIDYMDKMKKVYSANCNITVTVENGTFTVSLMDSVVDDSLLRFIAVLANNTMAVIQEKQIDAKRRLIFDIVKNAIAKALANPGQPIRIENIPVPDQEKHGYVLQTVYKELNILEIAQTALKLAITERITGRVFI